MRAAGGRACSTAKLLLAGLCFIAIMYTALPGVHVRRLPVIVNVTWLRSCVACLI
jgi:hypothetical protein